MKLEKANADLLFHKQNYKRIYFDPKLRKMSQNIILSADIVDLAI